MIKVYVKRSVHPVPRLALRLLRCYIDSEIHSCSDSSDLTSCCLFVVPSAVSRPLDMRVCSLTCSLSTLPATTLFLSTSAWTPVILVRLPTPSLPLTTHFREVAISYHHHDRRLTHRSPWKGIRQGRLGPKPSDRLPGNERRRWYPRKYRGGLCHHQRRVQRRQLW